MKYVETQNHWIAMKEVFYNQPALCNMLHQNWSVEFYWFPFNGISRWEALEAFVDKELDLEEWVPEEDEVWVRSINRTVNVTEVESELTYKIMNFRAWITSRSLDLVDDFIAKYPHSAPALLKSQVSRFKTFFRLSMKNSCFIIFRGVRPYIE